MKFCSECASPLEERTLEGRVRPVCPRCGLVFYPDPKVAVAVIVAKEGKLLMNRRAIEPGMGGWTFPSGYVDSGEKVEEAALREVWEETGVEVSLDRLVGVYSRSGDPVILIVYAGRILRGEPRPGAEALEVGFFPPENLPSLAFPRDHGILEDWNASQGEAAAP